MAAKKGDRVKAAVGEDAKARNWDALKRKTVPVTIRLDEDVRNRFEAYCRSRGIRLSTKLREIVMEYLLENRII